MCIIITKNSGIQMPSSEVLDTCFNNNSDGIGIAFARHGQVTVIKGLNSLEELNERITLFNLSVDDPIVFHFRIVSAGKKDDFNTHPFVIDDNQPAELTFTTNKPVLFHNGTFFDISEGKNAAKTDTQLLIEKIICKLYNDPVETLEIIEPLLGYNKLVALEPSGKINIYNEGFFHEKHGLKFSNDSFKTKKKPVKNIKPVQTIAAVNRQSTIHFCDYPPSRYAEQPFSYDIDFAKSVFKESKSNICTNRKKADKVLKKIYSKMSVNDALESLSFYIGSEFAVSKPHCAYIWSKFVSVPGFVAVQRAFQIHKDSVYKCIGISGEHFIMARVGASQVVFVHAACMNLFQINAELKTVLDNAYFNKHEYLNTAEIID